VSVELYTIDGDEQTEEVIAVFRFALGAAEASEIIHPETVTRLRQWCNVEFTRIHPPAPRVSPEEEVRASLQRSPYFSFWTNLQAGDEVRWTGTKSATYFVVDPEMQDDPTDGYGRRHTAYIKLRRHSGKEFWSHVGKVRPL
jgi:hypothetical protein